MMHYLLQAEVGSTRSEEGQEPQGEGCVWRVHTRSTAASNPAERYKAGWNGRSITRDGRRHLWPLRRRCRCFSLS